MSPKNNPKGGDEENDKKIEQQKAEIKDHASGLLERLVDFIKVTLSIREGVDKKRMLLQKLINITEFFSCRPKNKH